ncbi:MAG: hypothetical protein IPN95_00785 [Bacteroidetes bacterium]|nr:hypothetical protein [Bacteroidota bacterium]MBL0015160.1 hypothetical protein [Bacteroidota bacterium]
MKVPSTLLKAMLIAATVGVTATSCRTVKPQNVEEENSQTGPAQNESIIDKVKDLFSPSPRNGGDPCPACGMG